MKLLSTLRLLTRPSAPTSGAEAGAIYYDTTAGKPLYNDGSQWTSFAGNSVAGYPQDVTDTYTVPDNRQVIYFDRFQNDGVITITGTGTLIGMR